MKSFRRQISWGLVALCAQFGALQFALADEPHSMTGCLAAGAAEGTYMLENVEGGGGPVAIPKSAVDLAGHVGHKIEITGTTLAGTDPETHTMEVTAMKHLAGSCP